MPLIKKPSDKAFKSNIKTEMKAGKPQDQSLAIAYNTQRMAKKKGYASGGMVSQDHEEHYDSIADAIMRKKKMANGGMVDPDNMETPASSSPYDDDNYDAVMKELYDEDLGPQPEDSNEMGDEEEKGSEDKLDMISQIRKRMKRS